MRTAIVHYWLVGMRGGEKVLESICRLLPDADIFTLFYEPESVSQTIRSHRVTASFLNPARRHYRNLLPLMPMALENFDLRTYDLVVSSESGPAKGVLVSPDARHVCYCHTPMRYLWDLYQDYLNEWTSGVKRAFMAPFANYLRLWDSIAANRVDTFVANSVNTQRRLWRCYRRESTVIYPPVAVDTFYWKPSEEYYLVVSELAPYKRIDAAVKAFTANGRRLRVVGGGPEFRKLHKQAAKNVEFLGRIADSELREQYAGCRALILPGEEDFGITAVEALASGKPVIALGRGGALETVPRHAPMAGVLYQDPSPAGLIEAVSQFEAMEERIRPWELQAHAAQFSERRFQESLRAQLAHGTRSHARSATLG